MALMGRAEAIADALASGANAAASLPVRRTTSGATRFAKGWRNTPASQLGPIRPEMPGVLRRHACHVLSLSHRSSIRSRRAISMLIVAAAIVPVSAQDALRRVSLPRTESRDFSSKINNREYSVLVSLPAGYTQDATARFPVIDLTDADWVFATTAQTHFLLSFGNMVPAALIVGIVRAGVEEDHHTNLPW
jgi:hypothetical protein